ncbi:MAG: DNA-processing protein DprA [Acidobacteriia bacterium]|nr:DNA-processing protein DprA [Terriglobia bacterium]
MVAATMQPVTEPEIGSLQFNLRSSFEERAISPYLEMGAYEILWSDPHATFKSLSKRFARHPGSVPSDFVPRKDAIACAALVRQRFAAASIARFGVCVHGASEYPEKLRDAAHPIELLYYQGWWDLVASPSVAVVGTRKPSRDALLRTRRLVRELVSDDFTVVSGLAAGIDHAAHETAIERKGRTIAVIGTPLSHVYPKANAALQSQIAERFLVVSPVPVRRYESQDYRRNRLFFPERNILMSALTEATIIVEAGETSGTLIQAKAALQQGRKLFVLDTCFCDPRLTWPARLAAKGAIRVAEYDDIRRGLSGSLH